jgi:hypothetical protein
MVIMIGPRNSHAYDEMDSWMDLTRSAPWHGSAASLKPRADSTVDQPIDESVRAGCWMSAFEQVEQN